jgi:hypothetical protein
MFWTPRDGFQYNPRDHARDLQNKMATAVELVTKTLEKYYPDRLGDDGEPFEIVYLVTDFPQTACVDRARHRVEGKCDVTNWPPIFTFSSAPRDRDALPTLVRATLITLAESVEDAMNWPTYHTEPPEWARFRLFEIPEAQRDEYAFERLIPKIVWRGSDYPLLSPAYGEHHRESTCHSILGRYSISDRCQLADMLSYNTDEEAFEAMLASDALTPRARAVFMSRLDDSWIDARFANPFSLKHPSLVHKTQRSELAQRFKIDDDDFTTMETLAKYKYQIDLAGWGGTTWTGTIAKLSMPGCLFHHETIMTDSYFDSLKPYVHYIPVKEDLSDLRERFDQAQSSPGLCERVSSAATEWVRAFTSQYGLLAHNYEKLAIPLSRVVGDEYLIPFKDAHPELAGLSQPHL